MGPVNSIMGQILLIALTAPDDLSAMTVREVADFVVRPRLLTIPGVAQVIPMGGEVRQYRVAPNPAALRALGITYEQLEKALTGEVMPSQFKLQGANKRSMCKSVKLAGRHTCDAGEQAPSSLIARRCR